MAQPPKTSRARRAAVADATINRTLAALKRMFHMASEFTPPTGRLSEQACRRIALWMLAIFEVGCTYGWRHASLLNIAGVILLYKNVYKHTRAERLERQ
jgi:hypothetical protein